MYIAVQRERSRDDTRDTVELSWHKTKKQAAASLTQNKKQQKLLIDGWWLRWFRDVKYWNETVCYIIFRDMNTSKINAPGIGVKHCLQISTNPYRDSDKMKEFDYDVEYSNEEDEGGNEKDSNEEDEGDNEEDEGGNEEDEGGNEEDSNDNTII